MAIYKQMGYTTAGNGDRVYFNKPDGTLAMTTVQQMFIDVQVGDEIIVNAATTMSCLGGPNNSPPPYNDNIFTASQIVLSRNAQPTWYVPNSGDITIALPTGEDIHNGSQPGSGNMQPYYNHDQTGMHKFMTGQSGYWYIAFIVWCSSYSATGNSVAYDHALWAIPQQTQLLVQHRRPGTNF